MKQNKKLSLFVASAIASFNLNVLAADAGVTSSNNTSICVTPGIGDDCLANGTATFNTTSPRADSLNTGGNGATSIGNDGGTTSIDGNSVDITGTTNNITGTTNINTTGSASSNIGNNTGTTSINGSSVNITGTTNINTTGSASSNIGNTSNSSIGITGGASATQKGSLGITDTGVTSLSSTTAVGQAAPAMTISGQNGSVAPGTATGAYPLIPTGTGVLITGAGRSGGSDVYIASQDGKAAISVTNTGVSIISPSGANETPINVSSTNNYGIAGNYNAGSVSNNFGNGNSTSSGSVNNTIGSSAGGGGTVSNSIGGGTGISNNDFGVNTAPGASSTNNLGTTVAGSTAINTLGGGAGTTTNSVGNASGVSGSANNSFGNAVLGATSTNTIGGGTGVTTNSMGNDNVNTSIGLTAGNSSQNLSNGVSTTSVQSGGGFGNSVLGGGTTTSANSGTVLSGATGTFAKVDANGKITITPNPEVATQSVTAMTITNGLGNTHGIIVNEQQATISGGTTSSSMTLNNNGATFSNSSTGRPIQVHGVADGTSRYDAVNVQQMDAVKQGIAGVAAMNNIPSLESGKQFNLGIGFGGFDRETSFAIGGNARVTDNFVIKASAGRGFGANDSNISTTTWGVGGALSW